MPCGRARPACCPEAREDLGDEVTNEFYLSQIEIGTPVCHSLAEVRAELIRLRRGVVEAARRDGSRIAAAGTHPFSHWEGQAVTPKQRYLELQDDFQQLAREQIIFGCHVHIGIADRELAVAAMTRCRPWLAPVNALAASSPFWLGTETGYASYRTQLFTRWPMAGLPGVFTSRAQYEDLVASAGRRRHDHRRLEDLLGRPTVVARRDARVPHGRRLPDH